MIAQQVDAEQPLAPSRVAAVDGLRGLLATIVLAWHAFGPLGATWLLPPANLAVLTFFALSGYVLTRGWDGRFGIFLLRRFVRLWPVYAFCLAAGYFAAGVSPIWSEFLWYPLIDPDAKPSIDPPMWSLCFEAWAMPFMPFIVWAGAGGPRRAALCSAPFVLFGLIAPQFAIAVMFIAGAALARASFRSQFLESPLPQWLGRISYSLYLTHWLVLRLATDKFGVWGGVCAIPAAFVVGWLVWRAIELPSTRACRRIGRVAPMSISSSMGIAVHEA